MAKQRPKGRGFWRTLKRLAERAARLLVIGVGLAVLVGAVVWVHFWGTRIGNPTADSCGSCHVMQPYVDSQQAADMLASAHAVRGISCTDCHNYGAEQQLHDTLAYVRGDYQQPFIRVRYPMDICFQCHEHGSYEQIAWRTTDLGVTDAQAQGHWANPHQPPHFSELECYICHRVHSEDTLLCWECHNYEFTYPYLGDKPEATPQASSTNN